MVSALLTGATALGFALDKYVSLTSHAMFYVLTVIVVSYTLTRTAAVISAVAAVVLLNFFFVPPRFTFQVGAHENLTALFALLAVALVISHLGTALRRETEMARLNERRARELQELATELANCSQPLEAQLQAQRFLGRAIPGPSMVAVHSDGALNLPAESVVTFRDGMLGCTRVEKYNADVVRSGAGTVGRARCVDKFGQRRVLILAVLQAVGVVGMVSITASPERWQSAEYLADAISYLNMLSAALIALAYASVHTRKG